MATIDIRDEDELIDKIVFASDADNYGCAVEEACGGVFIHNRSERVPIRSYDIPYLIKALQKAQEIWKKQYDNQSNY